MTEQYRESGEVGDLRSEESEIESGSFVGVAMHTA